MKFPCVALVLMGISVMPTTRAADDPRPTGSAEFNGCHVSWNEHELVIGNRHFERKWRIDKRLLTATSFRDPAGDHSLLGVTRSGRLHPVEEESLVLDLATARQQTWTYRFQVFPAAGGVGIQFNPGLAQSGEIQSQPGSARALPSGIEATPAKDAAAAGDSLEDLMLSPTHLRFTQVTLKDQTDIHDQLVFENQWLVSPIEGPLKLEGNVFFVEDTLTNAGLLFLKQATLPHARPVKSEWDAQMTGGARRLRFAD